jgi:hypothetical protein
MKSFILLLLITAIPSLAFCQKASKNISIPDPNKKILIAETACGECRLGLPGKTCDLAIRIKGKAYFIDGTTIDEHGDAHAKDGFCNLIRKAEVQGEIINNRFKVTYFKLLQSPVKMGLRKHR